MNIMPTFQNKSNNEKLIILLMIPNGEGWHYLAVKNDLHYSMILRITSKHDGNFLCFDCLCSFRTKTNLNHIKKYVKIKFFVVI